MTDVRVAVTGRGVSHAGMTVCGAESCGECNLIDQVFIKHSPSAQEYLMMREQYENVCDALYNYDWCQDQ